MLYLNSYYILLSKPETAFPKDGILIPCHRRYLFTSSKFMATPNLLYILSLITLSASYGQKAPIVDRDILAYGIYLEDRNVLVPWNTAFDSISNFGNPTITRINRRSFKVSWDTVTVFRGIRSYMWYEVNKELFSRGKYIDFIYIRIHFDTTSIDHVKKILDGYFGFKCTVHKKKDRYSYVWRNEIFAVVLSNFPVNALLNIMRPKSNRR